LSLSAAEGRRKETHWRRRQLERINGKKSGSHSDVESCQERGNIYKIRDTKRKEKEINQHGKEKSSEGDSAPLLGKEQKVFPGSQHQANLLIIFLIFFFFLFRTIRSTRKLTD
jgi:hypothetical protein